MSIWSAVAELGKGVNAVFHWFTGGRTREAARLDREADRLEQEWHAADDPDRLNAVRARLRRLRDRAAARRLR